MKDNVTTLTRVFEQREPFDESYLGKTDYFVSCGDDSIPFLLWKLHSKQGGNDNQHFDNQKLENKPKWGHISSGLGIHLDDQTTISFCFHEIRGKIVGFYSGTSRVVDFGLMEEWVKHYLYENRLDDKVLDLSKQHCTSENFNDCLDFLKETEKLEDKAS